MRRNGKWIYLENHTMKNLDKMYEWSKDHELIGYIDFQNINEELNDAGLSLSIPDKKYRNKHYGVDAAFATMMYGIMTRKTRGLTSAIADTFYILLFWHHRTCLLKSDSHPLSHLTV